MDKRVLGRTGLSVSPLALGTVELGRDYGLKVPGAYGRPGVDEAVRIVHAALDRGINLIDTARAYGESEAILGRALRGRRDEVVLATKISPRAPDAPPLDGASLKRHMLDDLDTSLQLLQTDWIDLWQHHQVDEALLDRIDEVAEVFDAVKRAGKVRFVGASTYGSDLPLKALATGLFDTLQVGYSVLDQRLADRVFPLAAEKNVGIVARSVLLQGVLTDRGDYLPNPLAVLRDRSRQFRQLAADFWPALTPAQVALAFGLAQPRIGSVLTGVRTLTELEENLHAAQAPMPADLLERLYPLRLDDPDLLDPRWWEQFLLDHTLEKKSG